MDDTKELLERARRSFPAPIGVMDRLVVLRERKRRNERITAGVVALAIFLILVLAVGTQVLSLGNSTRQPADSPTGLVAPPGVAMLSGPIAFASSGGVIFPRPFGVEQVYLLAPDGTLIQLTHDSGEGNNEPSSWSPDGSQLIVQRNWGYGQDLFLVNVDGSGEIQPTNDNAWEGDAQFSPDGLTIAFQKEDGIDVMNRDGSGVRRLAAWSGTPFNQGTFSLSPDGSQILFAQSSHSGLKYDDDIYVANVDGTGKTRLTTGDHSDCQHDPDGGLYCDPFDDPIWSPDGSKIALIRITGTPAHYGGEIYVMNADGSGMTQLTSGSGSQTQCLSPAWSPDGSKIAMTCSSGVFVMNDDGTHVTQIASQGWYGATWSPGGSQIGLSNGRDLYVVNADGTDLTDVTDSTGQERGLPVWRP